MLAPLVSLDFSITVLDSAVVWSELVDGGHGGVVPGRFEGVI